MEDQNKRNLLYFEARSMRELYDSMENWQVENQKRMLSVSIQHDNGQFCCIAVSNPVEVIITDGTSDYAYVYGHALAVTAG